MIQPKYNPNDCYRPRCVLSGFRRPFAQRPTGSWASVSNAKSHSWSRRLRRGRGPPYQGGRWTGGAGAPYYLTLQALAQAIEKQALWIRPRCLEVLNTEHFETISGDWYYETQLSAIECYPGMVGQWQDGVFEVVDPGDRRTAASIYPKPPWPSE